MATNSQNLRWFHDIERELWSFFSLFGDLCARCARRTLRESREGRRKERDQWCCCMIDNQVHDNWESLNRVQSRRARDWYAALVPLDIGRMPGNGPCPALGPDGCRLRGHRPVTCTTQLCSKMLRVLSLLGLYDGATDAARQIEELIVLPDIMPTLYGTGKPRDHQRMPDAAGDYVGAVRQYRARMNAVPEKQRRQAIDQILPDDND